MLPVTDIAALGASGGAMTSTTPFMMTSTGSFSADASGYLRTPSGLVLLGWPADPDGTIPAQPRDSATGLAPVQINRSSFAAQPTTEVTLNANLPATETLAGAGGTALPVTVEYFDNLGTSQTLSMSFTPVVPASGQSNAWDMTITDQASGLSGDLPADLRRRAAQCRALSAVTQTSAAVAPLSSSYDATTGEIGLGLGSQTVALAIGSTNAAGPHHLSQLSDTFSTVGVTKDGSPAGTFTGVTIDENGLMSASYSTGFNRVIYQVPVVDVPDMNGLRVLDNQTFALSRSPARCSCGTPATAPPARSRASRARTRLPTSPRS